MPVVAMVPIMTLKAVIHAAEEGGYWAEVPALLDPNFPLISGFLALFLSPFGSLNKKFLKDSLTAFKASFVMFMPPVITENTNIVI